MSENDLIKLIYEDLKAHRVESAERHKDFEIRLRNVEETQNKQKGFLRALTILGLPTTGTLGAILSKFLN